ncbi:zinc finger domain-containing protein [Actinacidiphila glaucinigra]|uniref:zinc finger domain-containing protein n=1 Tax=Actinacidiphila glaucinigra TaxID=235986 RepID=UPI00366F01A8
MGKHQGAPMPASLRHGFRARAHPARSVPCPNEHCRARPHQSCIVRVNGRTLERPHPSRVARWAVTVACCPECQVQPGIPCHNDGQALADVHPRRIQEAKETLA